MRSWARDHGAAVISRNVEPSDVGRNFPLLIPRDIPAAGLHERCCVPVSSLIQFSILLFFSSFSWQIIRMLQVGQAKAKLSQRILLSIQPCARQFETCASPSSSAPRAPACPGMVPSSPRPTPGCPRLTCELRIVDCSTTLSYTRPFTSHEGT